MKTFWIASLALAALAPIADAQQGPPPGGPPPSGMGGGGMSRPTQAPSAPTASPPTSETIRVLSLASVQKDLAITSAELRGLAVAADSLRQSRTTSEDAALAAVSKALTPTQMARLQELLVQDMGYNAIQISAVRSQLSLSEDQTKAMDAVLASLETTRRALATSNATSAGRAAAEIQTGTNAALAKLLTAEQDAKLRSLAGRALGAK